MPEPAVLELGCGMRPTPGALHHDRTRHSPHVDVAHDLDRLPWPWADDAFDLVLALDVMEHLHLEVAAWLDEAWRLLRPHGQLYLRLPAWDNPVSYRDPTHVRLFHEESFYYWQPGHALHQDYGRVYFGATARWWEVLSVARVNADPRYGIGDLAVRLRKRPAEGESQGQPVQPPPDSPAKGGSHVENSLYTTANTSTSTVLQSQEKTPMPLTRLTSSERVPVSLPSFG